MWGDEIIKMFKGNKNFLGIFSRNTLPERSILFNQLPLGIIVNTDLSSQPGAHWVAIHIDKDGIGEYFDAFGRQPLYSEFEKYLFDNCENGFFINEITLQCTDCITCGEYCVAYLFNRFNGNSYSHFISIFTKDPQYNDELIKIFYDILK